MSVQLITAIDAMQDLSRQWRQSSKRIAFVPTMGSLHDGHLHLVKTARQHADKVVVSIFVNPLQFGPKEDFAKYPRTLEADRQKLARLAVDALFAPDEKTFYARARDKTCYVEVPELSDILCGASRPGHFRGVTTVVNKLFNIVQADVAVFGSKDYQQLTIIRQMVDDLAMPVRVIGVETVREADGLAMSSRNAYLSATQRAQAPTIYKCLQAMRERLRAGERDFEGLQTEYVGILESHGFRPDYLQIRDARDLAPPSKGTDALVILTAVWLGETRLIDNIVV